MANKTPELLRTWKVYSTAQGIVVEINGHAFELGATKDSFAFEVDRVAHGYNGAGTHEEKKA